MQKKYASRFSVFNIIESFLSLYTLFVVDFSERESVLNLISLLPILILAFAVTTYMLISYVRRLVNKSLLVLTENYFFDNLSLTSCGKIKWEDIVSITPYSLKKYKINVLQIRIKNVKEKISSEPKWKQVILSRLEKKYGTPYFISEKHIDYDITELKEILTNRIK